MPRRRENVQRQLFNRELRGGHRVQSSRDPNYYRPRSRRSAPRPAVPVRTRQQIARDASYNRWARSRGRPLRGRMITRNGRSYFQPY